MLAPQEVLAVREKLNFSRTVFARYLRTYPRTLENGEQGRAKPNAQTAVLQNARMAYSKALSSPFAGDTMKFN